MPRPQELENLLAALETEDHSSTMKMRKPLGPLLLVLVVRIIAVIAHAAMKTNSSADSTPVAGIATVCKEHGVPALAVVVTTDGKICDRVAAGHV